MRIRPFLEISNTKKSIIFWSTSSTFFVLLLIILYFANEELYISLANEDSFFENMTAILYLIAGILLIIAAFKNYIRNKIFLEVFLTLLLGLFFIFIAGEEVSWGQRILGINVPDVIKKHNVQQELTFHNLTVFQHLKFIDQHRLLNAFALLSGVIFPILYYFHKKFRNMLNFLYFPIIPLSCCIIFSLGILYGQTIAKIYPHYTHTEVKEFIFSAGYFIFSISLYTNKNKIE